MDSQPKRTILLIDDDTSLLVTLSDFFKFEGYEVVTADSGEQGLKRLETMTPDLIILDMSMPGMGGVGFLKEVSSTDGKPRYPVLVLTARANMAEFFANIDVDGFVAKPCDPEDLLMEVGRIIFLRSGVETPQKEDQTSVTTYKVLLAEDDEAVARDLKEALAEAGYLVDSVSNGPEALERAIVERPDAIVLKLVLTSMNGDAVARMLKEMPNTKSIPVIIYDEGATAAGARLLSAGLAQAFCSGNDVSGLLKALKNILGEE